jgi:predicted nucleic acid-binding protein
VRTIVDTSVWSLAFRRKPTTSDPAVEKLHALIRDGHLVYLIGVILLEILQGIKTGSQREKVRQSLEPFTLLDLVREDYVEAATLSCLCRSKGVQAGTVDFLIAGAAIRNDCALLTTDKDFQHIAKLSALVLL